MSTQSPRLQPSDLAASQSLIDVFAKTLMNSQERLHGGDLSMDRMTGNHAPAGPIKESEQEYQQNDHRDQDNRDADNTHQQARAKDDHDGDRRSDDQEPTSDTTDVNAQAGDLAATAAILNTAIPTGGPATLNATQDIHNRATALNPGQTGQTQSPSDGTAQNLSSTGLMAGHGKQHQHILAAGQQSQTGAPPQSNFHLSAPAQNLASAQNALQQSAVNLQTTAAMSSNSGNILAAGQQSQTGAPPQSNFHLSAPAQNLASAQNALQQSAVNLQTTAAMSSNSGNMNPNSTAAQLAANHDGQSSTQTLATAQNGTKQISAPPIVSTAELTAVTAQVRRAAAGNPAITAGSAAPTAATDVAANRSHNTSSTAMTGVPATPAATSPSFSAVAINSLSKPVQTQAPQIIKQMSVEITSGIKKGDTDIKIQLRPDHLGKVEVKLEISKDGLVKGLVMVDKPETLELLQRDSRGLERSLQDAGLKTDSNSLSFALNDQGDSGNSKFNQGHNGSGTAQDANAPSQKTTAEVDTHADQPEEPTIGDNGMINMVA
jgi:hypothetical protein